MEGGSQIRVLYIDHVTHLSGAEQSLFDLVVGLAGGPIEPVVVLPEDGPLATQLRGAGVLVRKVKMSKRLLETSRATLHTRPLVALIRLVSFVAVGFRLRAIIKETNPAVIHTNTLKAHLLAILPAKLSRTPLVWHMRDILPKGWLRRAFNGCARFADRIVVPSRAVAAAFGRNKAVYRKLRLIPNGIRVDTFDDHEDEGLALREEIGAEDADVVIGIVGRIAPWKGQDVFVHAAAMVAERHPEARFAIVGAPMFGDDDFQHELSEMVYQYGLDGQLMFTGWRGAQEAMAALDVVVHASTEPEPFGRTIAEAMAAGLPVVAADGGATREILPPNAGFLVPPGHPEILADALESLLEDDELREQLGENGKAAALRFFDVRRTIGAVAALYAEVVRESVKRAARRRKRARTRKQGRAAARPMPQTRPMNPDRRPPMLRPETPDLSVPQRTARPRRDADPYAAGPARPVRRTARIDDDDDDEAVPPSRAPRPQRAPAAPGRRPVPAMREHAGRAMPRPGAVPHQSRPMPRPGAMPRPGDGRTAAAPPRRIHSPAAFEGGHVIRRPVVLEDPRFAADLPAVFESFDRPLEMPPSRRDRRRGPKRHEPAPAAPASFEEDDDDDLEIEGLDAFAEDVTAAPAAPARPAGKTAGPAGQRKKTKESSRATRRRPAPDAPVSADATALVLDPAPEPEPVRSEPVPVVPVARAKAPSADKTVTPMSVTVRPKPVYEIVKRIVDVIVATLILVVGAPLWLLVTLAIKLESRGPALFKGTVWGKDGVPFTYYKFRSMRVEDADDGHRKFIEEYVKRGIHGGVVSEEGKQVFKFVGDSRITRVGRLIRKLSIDEIPQLVNVLKGDMTLVGPRPPLGYEYELYDEWAMQRLVVRPGMTGLQQTYARHSASFTEKVEMDLAYIRDRSLWLDFTILLKTIPAAFKGE
ncbi:MAG TPA: sugar transferase [Actinomycetota bacterium]|nr:sugar transferase [Actinomycetota bacterium]